MSECDVELREKTDLLKAKLGEIERLTSRIAYVKTRVSREREKLIGGMTKHEHEVYWRNQPTSDVMRALQAQSPQFHGLLELAMHKLQTLWRLCVLPGRDRRSLTDDEIETCETKYFGGPLRGWCGMFFNPPKKRDVDNVFKLVDEFFGKLDLDSLRKCYVTEHANYDDPTYPDDRHKIS